ncbi:MAG: glutaredoxin domain-containing protein [Sulfurospirillaceae bacterium]|nr:glutaredoxin domain-containing protein [Sulfurospirillaceae bacterium]
MPEIKKQKRVIIFTAPGCSWCTTAKQYLKRNNIKFKTIDVSKDKDAARDCQKHGCHGVPVLLIGSKWICGFDKPKINKELNL